MLLLAWGVVMGAGEEVVASSIADTIHVETAAETTVKIQAAGTYTARVEAAGETTLAIELET